MISGHSLYQSVGRRSQRRTDPPVARSISTQRSTGTGRLPLRHSEIVGGLTSRIRAKAETPPAVTHARSIAAIAEVFMPAILGITYPAVKALPWKALPGWNLAMPITSKELGARLREQMSSKGTQPPELAALCGVRVPSVYDWLEHGRIAKKHLPRLAAFFGTSLGYWLGEEGEEDMNPLERQLLTLSRGLSEDMKDELLRYANFLHNLGDGGKPSAAIPFPKAPPPPRIPPKKKP